MGQTNTKKDSPPKNSPKTELLPVDSNIYVVEISWNSKTMNSYVVIKLLFTATEMANLLSTAGQKFDIAVNTVDQRILKQDLTLFSYVSYAFNDSKFIKDNPHLIEKKFTANYGSFVPISVEIIRGNNVIYSTSSPPKITKK